MVSFDELGRKVKQEKEDKRRQEDDRRQQEQRERDRQKVQHDLGTIRKIKAQETWGNSKNAIDEWERRAKEYVDFVNKCASEFRQQSYNSQVKYHDDWYGLYGQRTSILMTNLFGDKVQIGRIYIRDFDYIEESDYYVLKIYDIYPVFLDSEINYRDMKGRLHCDTCIKEVDQKVSDILEPKIAINNISKEITNSFVGEFFRVREMVRDEKYKFECHYDENDVQDAYTILFIGDYGSVIIPRLTREYKEREKLDLLRVGLQVITPPSYSDGHVAGYFYP